MNRNEIRKIIKDCNNFNHDAFIEFMTLRFSLENNREHVKDLSFEYNLSKLLEMSLLNLIEKNYKSFILNWCKKFQTGTPEQYMDTAGKIIYKDIKARFIK